MNLFLPYVDDIDASVQCLDNRRLCKQILECKIMMDIAFEPEAHKGYRNHPIVRHYTQSKRQIKFLRYYANKCCEEYKFRFGKEHMYASEMPPTKYFLGIPTYTPIYVDGKYSTFDHDEVSYWYKMKLAYKWANDKYPPRWTNRSEPSFYKELANEAVRFYDELRSFV